MGTRPIAAVAAALLLGFAGASRGELIELQNGKVLQGDIVAGQTTDDGLAVELYDTGGVVVVKWDHIEDSRRKKIRQSLSLDLPEETEVLVPGHRVLLTSGDTIVGVAENPRDSQPLRMKTRAGVRPYDRSMLAGPVEDIAVPGLVVYTEEELYRRKDEAPPETAAAHKALAQYCLQITAFDHAKEHLLAAKDDKAFMETDEGKAVEALLRQTDVMIRNKGAQDLKTQIQNAEHAERWNEALKVLNQLDTEYKDDNVRKAVGFDLLAERLHKGRDKFFQRTIQLTLYRAMDRLIEVKALERKPRESQEPARGAVQSGTLAAARQWAGKELYKGIADKVRTDLGLTPEEFDRYWQSRSGRNLRRASYGTGSFIVVKKAAKPKSGNPEPKRRPPGETRPDKKNNQPPKAEKSDRPKTDEEWWEEASSSERKAWLTANFVESIDMFTIVGKPENNCEACGGTGFLKGMDTTGQEALHLCAQCNGCGVVKVVSYR